MKRSSLVFFHSLIFGFLLVLAGCHRRSVPVQVVKSSTTDTVIIKQVEVKLDTVIKTKADTLVIIDTINCNDAAVQVASKDGEVKATIKNGILTIKSVRHSKIVPITVSKQVPQTERVRLEVKEVPVEIVVTNYKVPKWCWWLLVINLGYLVYRFRQPIASTVLKLFNK